MKPCCEEHARAIRHLRDIEYCIELYRGRVKAYQKEWKAVHDCIISNGWEMIPDEKKEEK